LTHILDRKNLDFSGRTGINWYPASGSEDGAVKLLGIFSVVVLLGLVGEAGAQTLTTLYSFTGLSDGYPESTLVQGTDGSFYGTTAGGSGVGDIQLYGSVFRITPAGSLSNLWVFSGSSDGAFTSAALVQGSDGNFYGTTQDGGTSGWGNVFRVTPGGSLSNLYSFGPPPNPALPYAGLVQGTDGNLYGTTGYGGNTNGGAFYGRGTVFRMSPSGSLTNLYLFSGPDGWAPYAGLVQGSDGNFYGTTYAGGASAHCPNGCGTVYRISPSGSLTNLWSFTGGTDGANPYAGVVEGADGNFYGTTIGGGTHGTGTVYRISPSGGLTNLWSFTGGSDGANPWGLVQGSDGSFYGTTPLIGVGHSGTVYRISPNGSFTNLWSFTNGSDGANPQAGLVQGSDGSFYGTTSQLLSGPNKFGTVFKLTVPLNPPANQVSSFQPAGANVVFTIPSVAGETYQLQFATDLVVGNWSNVPGVSVTNSIGASLTLTNLGGAAGSQVFYRFAITP
jgi:uncharacterized repeat protein (TIGR03803 family)